MSQKRDPNQLCSIVRFDSAPATNSTSCSIVLMIAIPGLMLLQQKKPTPPWLAVWRILGGETKKLELKSVADIHQAQRQNFMKS